jgi:deoxyribose-phosphate aldolase
MIMNINEIVNKGLVRFNDEYKPYSRDVDSDINLADYIDHTLLKQDATEEKIDKLCEEAKEYNFCSVCVNTSYLKRASEKLNDSKVKKCVVIGFPLGACSTETKAFETKWAVENGADEVDMVINVGYLKSKKYEATYDDIRKVVEASGKAIVKVIIETCLLTDEEKVIACVLSKEAGADFVKTSTGFSTGGATVEDVQLMKFVVGENIFVKAAGGVRSYEDAIKMIVAGADRIGTSSGIKILKNKEVDLGEY